MAHDVLITGIGLASSLGEGIEPHAQALAAGTAPIVDEASFVAMREARDATLSAPVLLLPALQVNIRAGRLPDPEGNGRRYLKIPLKL